MVVVRNLATVLDEILVVVEDGTLQGIGSLHWYQFDDAMSVGAPVLTLDGYTDLYDPSRTKALGYAYQLCVSIRSFNAGTQSPWAYLYRTMHSEFNDPNLIMDFVLQYMNWTAPPNPDAPWALIPLICGQADRVAGLSGRECPEVDLVYNGGRDPVFHTVQLLTV